MGRLFACTAEKSRVYSYCKEKFSIWTGSYLSWQDVISPRTRKRSDEPDERGVPFSERLSCFVFAWLPLFFRAFLWREALRVSSQEQGSVSASGEAFRPQVGDPPYRVATDAGHGGNDPGARGVVEEKDMTAATASVLLAWLEQDPNYIPLRTRDAFDQTATPAERAAAANAQAPQLLLSIHGNSAANGSSATGFECYPSVPGRTWHAESYYFAQKLAEEMQNAGSTPAWARRHPLHLLSGK